MGEKSQKIVFPLVFLTNEPPNKLKRWRLGVNSNDWDQNQIGEVPA